MCVEQNFVNRAVLDLKGMGMVLESTLTTFVFTYVYVYVSLFLRFSSFFSLSLPGIYVRRPSRTYRDIQIIFSWSVGVCVCDLTRLNKEFGLKGKL